MAKDNQLLRDCLRYARAECANNQGGMCVPRNEPCFAFIPPAKACTYFLHAVIPMSAELSSIFREMEQPEATQALKMCIKCNAPFIPASNRAKYCTACRETVKREQATKRKRVQRICHALERQN